MSHRQYSTHQAHQLTALLLVDVWNLIFPSSSSTKGSVFVKIECALKSVIDTTLMLTDIGGRVCRDIEGLAVDGGEAQGLAACRSET
jgi:hypothetical protein